MKKKNIKLTAILLILTMFLSACAQNTANVPDQELDGEEEGQQNVQDSDEPVVLKVSKSQTVSTFNPHTAQSAEEYEQLCYVNGLLYNRIYNEEEQKSDFYPELADGNPVMMDDKGAVWNIKILEGNTFEDGTPINANSFEYSFKMLLDPKLANRNYNSMYILKNAENYYNGQCEWDDVGIKALDDYTLEITCEEKYIPDSERDIREIFGFVGCGLVHEATFEACFNADRTENDYGTTTDKFVASGPYKISKLIEGQYTEYEKRTEGNPSLDVFTVDTLQVKIVGDANTAIQMFENGELDIASAGGEEYDEYPDLYQVYTPDTYGLFVNSKSTTNPILKDKNFRYALYWGLDRDTLIPVVYRVMKPSGYHYTEGTTVPDPDNPSESIDYRDSKYAEGIELDGHKIENNGYNKELALEYFDKAYEANGSTPITVEIQYIEDNVSSKAWSEALQEYYQNLFGQDKFTIKLRAIPAALLYESLNRDSLDYEIMAAGGIYHNLEKPWANSNWVSSGADVYNSQYTVISDEAAKKYDDLYYACNVGEFAHDVEKRNEAVSQMEQILYEECTYIPTYARGVRYMISGDIEVLMKDGVGDPFVEFALLQARYK